MSQVSWQCNSLHVQQNRCRFRKNILPPQEAKRLNSSSVVYCTIFTIHSCEILCWEHALMFSITKTTYLDLQLKNLTQLSSTNSMPYLEIRHKTDWRFCRNQGYTAPHHLWQWQTLCFVGHPCTFFLLAKGHPPPKDHLENHSAVWQWSSLTAIQLSPQLDALDKFNFKFKQSKFAILFPLHAWLGSHHYNE